MSGIVEKSDGTLLLACGPQTKSCKCECGRGGECGHKFDGPEQEVDYPSVVSVTCSVCGLSAYEHSIWTSP